MVDLGYTNQHFHIEHAAWANEATCADKTALYNHCIIDFSKDFYVTRFD